MRGSRSCSREDPEIFRKVKEAVGMRKVAEHYGVKADGRGWCACPFHQDRHPSMKLFPDGRGYYCFTCGAGGDQITFAARCLGVSNSAAARELARVFGVPLTEPATYREKREAELSRRRRWDIEEFAQRSKLWLGLYRGLLCGARRDPKDPRFLEGIHRLEYVEYLLDLVERSPEEVYGNREAVKKIGEIERRAAGWYSRPGEDGAVSG